MEEILCTEGLGKDYGKRRAVLGVNLSVRRGEIYGFLGRNGAGKSTTIRMLVGLSKPTAGTVSLFGKRVRFGEYRHLERIGSIVETPGFYPNLTARENLDVHRRLMGVPDRRSVDRALSQLGIEDTKQRVGQYSTGTRQRLGIARALLHEPELLILDEPVNGLDPAGIKEVRRLLADLARERKVTVFLSSHILAEIEKLADRIGIIHRGRLIQEIGIEEMERMSRQYMELRVADSAKACFLLERRLAISDFRVTESGIVRIYEGLDRAEEINRELVTGGVAIKEMKTMRDSLEDHFLRMTEESQ